MLSEREKARIETWLGVTVLDARMNDDASEIVGEPTIEVAGDHESIGPITLYLSGEDDGLSVEWDVSGYPSWYRK